jgi:hypothetical protein
MILDQRRSGGSDLDGLLCFVFLLLRREIISSVG